MAGSDIVIEYDGDDITAHCLFAQTRFEAQMAAIPGACHVEIKDTAQVLDFTTGKELTLDVDGIRLWGGYVMQVSKTYFFPADNTQVLANVRSRKWVLDGVDYNVLLDKRVLRKTSNYTQQIPNAAGPITDGGVIRTYFPTYFDIPSGFNFTSSTYVQDNHTYSDKFTWMTQGTFLREQLDNLALYGSVFWIDADKQFNFLPVQDTAADWGFSDRPNNNAIGVGTPTRGFRDGEFTEDATSVINDALVWGGSEWAVNGDVVFARREDATSIADHGRWQTGEVMVGKEGFKTQAGVDARARVIVNGNESGTTAAGSQGMVNPERQFRGTWFSVDVPEVGGDPVHLRPGQVVPILLWVFSEDSGATPFEVTLPLRSLSISFPGLDPNGDAYIQFDGFFGVLMSDPKWLWKYLQGGKTQATNITPVASADNDSIDPVYGSEYRGEPSPAPDGVETVFTIPFGYVGGTVQLYVNGLRQDDTAFIESDPAAGEITLTFTPVADDELFVEAILSG